MVPLVLVLALMYVGVGIAIFFGMMFAGGAGSGIPFMKALLVWGFVGLILTAFVLGTGVADKFPI